MLLPGSAHLFVNIPPFCHVLEGPSFPDSWYKGMVCGALHKQHRSLSHSYKTTVIKRHHKVVVGRNHGDNTPPPFSQPENMFVCIPVFELERNYVVDVHLIRQVTR